MFVGGGGGVEAVLGWRWGGGGGAIFTLAPKPELVIEKKNRHEISFKSNNCRL